MGLIKNVHLIYLDGCIFKPVSVLLTYISRAFLPLPWLRQPWQSHKAHCTVIRDWVKNISYQLIFDAKYISPAKQYIRYQSSYRVYYF